ncbi:MAG: type IV pilus assembly protein PilF [Halioglobus sp.]
MELRLPMSVNKLVPFVIIVMLSSLLGACVTTTEGGFTEKASPEKALERRVSLARQYIGEGNWDYAKRNLLMAYEIDPDDAQVHEVFALLYQRTGEFELAEENFEKSIRLDRGCSRCRNNYAAFLYSQGEYEKAESQLELVVADSLYTGRARAFVNLGLCRKRLENIEGAEQAFSRALAMERTNQIALLEMAQMRYDADDLVEANKFYDIYHRVARQQSARGLFLGIRLAQEKGDVDAEASFGLALRNRFPDSEQYKLYKKAQQGG